MQLSIKQIITYAFGALATLFILGPASEYVYECYKEDKCPNLKTFNAIYQYLISSVLEAIPLNYALTIVFGLLYVYQLSKMFFIHTPLIAKLKNNISKVGLYETLTPIDQKNLLADRKKLWDLYFGKSEEIKTFIDILGINGEMTFSKKESNQALPKTEAAPLRQTLDNIKQNLPVRILLLSPSSIYFIQRVNELYPCNQSEKIKNYKVRLEKEILSFRKQTVAAVEYLSEKINAGYKIEWQFYDKPPVWKLIITDDFVWQQIYPKGVHVEYAQINIFSSDAIEAKSSGLYTGFKTVFDLLWDQYKQSRNAEIPELPYDKEVQISSKNKRIKFKLNKTHS